MFERPPPRAEWLSWCFVALWAGVIFATVPIARALQRVVNEAWGEQAFFYATLAVIAFALGWTGYRLWRAERMSLDRWLGLFVSAALFAGYVYTLRGNPVEALHFLEYGVLGVLAFRALSHRVRDLTIYPAAALVGAIVGMLDEALQWLTPNRVWDLRDIWFNFVGAGIAQLGIATGVRPSLISPRFTAPGVAALARIAIASFLLLWLSMLNTPDRIQWYASRTPGLGFLLENSKVMVEYGHLYDIAEIGRFRSRFSPEAIARIDADRGPAAGTTLAEAHESPYAAFLARHTPLSDPFLHEARVHLFSRDRNLEMAVEQAHDEYWHHHRLTVAYRENRILEHLFPNTLSHSRQNLSADQLAGLKQKQFPDMEYESLVSKALITRFDERQVALGGAVILILLVAAERFATRHSARRLE